MGDVSTPTPTLERLKAILRRDLKLPADVAIADDMPLTGGQMDFDSLDILLVLTSAEKEFGVTITAQPGQPAALRDLLSFAQFIDAQKSGQPPAVDAPQATSTSAGSLLSEVDHLPHQPPFRFVTRYTAIVPGSNGMGEWKITGEEPFFAGHFPGRPIVPGVLISESMAQVSGLVVSGHSGEAMALAHVDVKFREPVLPPATVVISSALSREMGDLKQFEVVARVNGQIVAQGNITLSALPAPGASR
jgi:3-hydroxyacyl-[acyl-carrier-protein] dehydratase